MSPRLTRRHLLAAGCSTIAAPWHAAKAAQVPSSAAGGHRLLAGTRTLDVNGRAAVVFGLTAGNGQAGLSLAPGERFRVDLTNGLDKHTIIHWHGQLPPWTQDGFPWPQTPPLAPGVTRSYDYAPIPGTYWMHSHDGLQEQSLMTAPLIVHTAAELREDRQEIVLMLHDFSFRTPDELLSGLTGTKPSAVHDMVRQSENVAAPATHMSMPGAVPMHRMASGGMTGMAGMASGAMGRGHAMDAMTMDTNDIDYDDFLANDRTISDPAVVRVGRGGRVRLRVINGSSSSQFWIDLGALVGRIVAVDGHPVHPVGGSRFPLAIAQRMDIFVDLPSSGAFPVLARLEGSRRRTGIVLATPGARIPKIGVTGRDRIPPIDNALEMRLAAIRPLMPRKPGLMHRIALSGAMKPYRWALNGEYWPHVTPLMLQAGQRVEIELVNRSSMAHPMHLHGHAFQVIGIDGRTVNGAVRDTVLVTPRPGRVRIAFDADNPGRWPFHCHNLYHMATGMMTEFRYRGIAV
jgi:FtsP/CotA-like multicopper oxidase with cupredoxin domain